MYVQTTYLNATEGYVYGESDICEAFTDKPGKLYRSCVREYGRCSGRLYVGSGTPIGWVFVKRQKYEDTGEAYIQETWITLHETSKT